MSTSIHVNRLADIKDAVMGPLMARLAPTVPWCSSSISQLDELVEE